MMQSGVRRAILVIASIVTRCLSASPDATSTSTDWKSDVCLQTDIESASPINRISVVGWKLEDNGKAVRLEYVVHSDGGETPREVGIILTNSLENDVSVIGTKTVYSSGSGVSYHEKIENHGALFANVMINPNDNAYITNPISIPVGARLYALSVGYQCSFGMEYTKNRLSWSLGYDNFQRPLEIQIGSPSHFTVEAVDASFPISQGGIASGTMLKLSTNIPLSNISWIDINSKDGLQSYKLVPAPNSQDPTDPLAAINSLNIAGISGTLIQGASGLVSPRDNQALVWFPNGSKGQEWEATMYWRDDNAAVSLLQKNSSEKARVSARLNEFLTSLNGLFNNNNLQISTDNDRVRVAIAEFAYGNLIDRGLSAKQGMRNASWFSPAIAGFVPSRSVIVDGILSAPKQAFQLGGVFQFALDAHATAYGNGFSRVDLISTDLPFKASYVDDESNNYRLTWPNTIAVSTVDPITKVLSGIAPCQTADCLDEENFHADLTSDQWKSIKANGLWLSSVIGDEKVSDFIETSDGSDIFDLSPSFLIELSEVDGNGEIEMPHTKKFVGHQDENPIIARPAIALHVGKTNNVLTYEKVIKEWKIEDNVTLPVGNPNLYKVRHEPSEVFNLAPSDILLDGEQNLERRDFLATVNKRHNEAYDLTVPSRAGPIESELTELTKVRTTIGYFENGTEKVVIPFEYYPANRIHYIFYSGNNPDERDRQKTHAVTAALNFVRDKHLYVETVDATLLNFNIDFAPTGSTGWWARYIDNACTWANGIPIYRNVYGMNGEYDDFGHRLASPLTVSSIGLVLKTTQKTIKNSTVTLTPVYDIRWESKADGDPNSFVERDHNNQIYDGWVDQTFDQLLRTHYQQKSNYDLANRIDHGDGLATAFPKVAVVAGTAIPLLPFGPEEAAEYAAGRELSAGIKAVEDEVELEELLIQHLELSEWKLSGKVPVPEVQGPDKLLFGKYQIGVAPQDGRAVYKNMIDIDPGIPKVVSPDLDKGTLKKIADGWTNRDFMRNRQPPIGPDGRKIELHHIAAKEPGPMIEILGSAHLRYTKRLHGDIVPGASWRRVEELDAQYTKFRGDWWEARALDFQ
jgi:hypothetical protein